MLLGAAPAKGPTSRAKASARPNTQEASEQPGTLAVQPVSGSPTQLTLTSLPFDGVSQQEAVYTYLVPILETGLGIRVSFVASISYTDVVRQLASGEVDVAFMGAAAYIQARRIGSARAILRTVRDHRPYYYGVILTRQGSLVNNVADLRGKRIAFVDRNSTSGYFYPRVLLKQAGIDPEEDIFPIFAGSHRTVVRLVTSGRVDAGACFDGAVKLMDGAEQLVEVARTKQVPGDPVVVRPGLGVEFVAALRELLMGLAEVPEAKTFLEMSGITGFIWSLDKDYDEVAELIDAM